MGRWYSRHSLSVSEDTAHADTDALRTIVTDEATGDARQVRQFTLGQTDTEDVDLTQVPDFVAARFLDVEVEAAAGAAADVTISGGATAGTLRVLGRCTAAAARVGRLIMEQMDDTASAERISFLRFTSTSIGGDARVRVVAAQR